MKYYKTIYPSPIGTMVLVSDLNHLLMIRFADGSSEDTTKPMPEPQRLATRWLDTYFSGLVPSPEDLPLLPSGTEFQKEVWTYLLSIPYGQTVTYGQIAAAIAKKRGMNRMSAQAVGRAVGANPIPIIIPCHRVVGSTGQLIGYSCGIDRKEWLLCHESQKQKEL